MATKRDLHCCVKTPKRIGTGPKSIGTHQRTTTRTQLTTLFGTGRTTKTIISRWQPATTIFLKKTPRYFAAMVADRILIWWQSTVFVCRTINTTLWYSKSGLILPKMKKSECKRWKKGELQSKSGGRRIKTSKAPMTPKMMVWTTESRSRYALRWTLCLKMC